MNNFGKEEFVEIVRYAWTIDNFFELFNKTIFTPGTLLSSPPFPREGSDDHLEAWRVDLKGIRRTPNDDSDTGKINYIIIYVRNLFQDCSMSSDFPDYCKIEMLNSNHVSICTILSSKTVMWPDHCFITYCKVDKLVDEQVESKNTLTMVISIGTDPKPRLQTPMYKDVLQIPRIIEAKNAIESPFLMKSLKQMYDQNILTDVIIKNGDQNFHCHKVVLAGSSDFFRNIFQGQIKDSAKSVVELDGIFDAAVIEAMIQYIYTDKAPPDVDKLFLNLYMAADYFQLQDLKTICVETMCERVNQDNASEILQLADKYKEEELKCIVLKFISKNLSQFHTKDGNT